MPKWIGLALGMLAAFGYFLSVLGPQETFNRMCFYVFQARDVFRAAELSRGSLIWFGPEMTGGGNLPGPAYYVLLAFSGILGPGLLGPWRALMLLVFLGCWAAYCWLRRPSPVAAILIFSLLALAPTTSRLMSVFLNVSYMIPFAILFVILILVACHESDGTRRRRAFLGAVLAGALGLQFHFSIIFLLAALPFLRLHLPWKTWGEGGAIAGATITPYLIGRALSAAGFELGQENSPAGSPVSAPFSLFHMWDYLPSLPFHEFAQSSLIKIFTVIPLPAFPLAVAYLSHKNKMKDPRTRPLLVLTAFAAIPYSYWFLADIGVRYSIPMYVTTIFLTVVLFMKALEAPRALHWFNSMAALALAAVIYGISKDQSISSLDRSLVRSFALATLPLIFIIFTPGFLKFNRPAMIGVLLFLLLGAAQNHAGILKSFNVSTQFMPRLQHWRLIWQHIYSSTGWDYEDAVSRIFFVHHHVEQDARPTYALYRRNSGLVPLNPDAPDGYFVSFNKDTEGMSVEQLKIWLLEQNIPEDVKAALRENHIELGPIEVEAVLVVPYKVKNTQHVHRHFHNYGRGYLTGPDADFLSNYAASTWAGRYSNKDYLFKWNECPDLHRFCNTGAMVRVEPINTSPEDYRIKVRVVGMVLSQVSPWISPNWTQGWIGPYLEVLCDGKTQRFPLATSIGYRRRYATSESRPLIWGNNSLVAPFEREFHVKCRSEIAELSIGRDGSEIETIYKVQNLPAKKLSVKLSSTQPSEG